MAHPQRRYRRESRYSAQLRVTVEPATAAALAADADAAQTSVSAVIRDALARGLPLARDARRKRRRGPALEHPPGAESDGVDIENADPTRMPPKTATYNAAGAITRVRTSAPRRKA